MPRGRTTALAGLTALAAGLRFATIDLQSFWLDEAATVHLVRMDLFRMLGEIPKTESTPPLYYVLAWSWTKVFGSGEVGLRSLSALFGVALVPVLYVAAARLVTPRAGLVAAALAATNPILVWYSQEARAYSLLVLLCAVSLIGFAAVLERPGRRELALWAIASALAVATHYFAIFLVGAEAVWLLRKAERRRPVALATAAVAAVALALLPLLLEQSSRELASYIGEQSLVTRILQVPKQFLVGFDSLAEAAATVVALVLAALGAALVPAYGDARERRGALIAGGLALAAVGVPILIDLRPGADYLVTRNVLGAWPAFAVALAAGFGARRAGRLGVAAAAALCALSVAVVISVFSDSSLQRDDWRGLAKAIGPADMPRALVITPFNGHLPLEAYLGRMDPFPEPGATVQEIDIVAVNDRRPGDRPRPPRPDVGDAGPFGIVERRFEKTFTLIRLRADRPMPVPKLGLRGLRPGADSLDIEIQR